MSGGSVKRKIKKKLWPKEVIHDCLGQTTSSDRQGQLLEGVECHFYLYCFTFDDINLNRALVIIVLFPTKYSNKKVCANHIGKLKAL